jgi:cytochrome b subunit of formate dehydrogenase
MSQKKSYLRFSVLQRLEHWLLFASFTLLALTGLPQKFVGTGWADAMIAAFGGIETIRVIHRISAIVLLAESVYHLLALLYKILVQRVELSMLPGLQDAKDLFGVLFYNLGLRRERPRMPHYNYAEKMEYWAVVWGTVIMALTGFMLWNPIATSKLLPGSFIPAAKAAHGGEAILAVLAILVWHVYWVHVRRFNKSMFIGKIEAEEMTHEHALELERLTSGALPPSTPAEVEIKRSRIFWPVAMVTALALIFGLYLFATFENTAPAAIAAVPTPVAFQPVQLPAGATLHATLTQYTGPETCAECHPEAVKLAVASTHNQRLAAAGPQPWLAKLADSNTAAAVTPDCLLCHAKNLQSADRLASAQTVQPAGGETCTRCHGGYPPDEAHAQVGLTCIGCHPATKHQIQTGASCASCHAAQPHANPFLNFKHQRLDCRTCHVDTGETIMADTGQATQNPTAGFFDPVVTTAPAAPRFAWFKNGQLATIDTDGAMIVPVITVTLRAPVHGQGTHLRHVPWP